MFAQLNRLRYGLCKQLTFKRVPRQRKLTKAFVKKVLRMTARGNISLQLGRYITPNKVECLRKKIASCKAVR